MSVLEPKPTAKPPCCVRLAAGWLADQTAGDESAFLIRMSFFPLPNPKVERGRDSRKPPPPALACKCEVCCSRPYEALVWEKVGTQGDRRAKLMPSSGHAPGLACHWCWTLFVVRCWGWIFCC